MKQQKIQTLKLIFCTFSMLLVLSGCSQGESFSINVSSPAILAGESVQVSWKAQPATEPLNIFKKSTVDSIKILFDGIVVETLNTAEQQGVFSFTPKATGNYQFVARFKYFERYWDCEYDCPFNIAVLIKESAGSKQLTANINVDIDIPVTANLFADTKLFACIDATNPATIASLTTLDCADLDIQSISGLAYFQNLESLNLAGNPITTSTLQPIRYLPHLNYLNLSGITSDCYSVQEYQIERGSAVAVETECPALELIADVEFNESNIEPQCKFANSDGQTTTYVHRVNQLDCSSTDAAALTVLTDIDHFYNLEKLSIDNNTTQCLDIAEITGRSAMTELKFEGCFSHYELLQNFTALRKLELYQFPESTISFIDSMANLSLLTVQGSPGFDTAPIASRTQLKSLALPQNNLNDLTNLQALSVLDQVDLGGNQFADINLITSTLPKLLLLDLNNNQLHDIAGIDLLARAGGTINLENNNITSGWQSLLNSYWAMIYLKGNNDINCQQLADLVAVKNVYSKPASCVQ